MLEPLIRTLSLLETLVTHEATKEELADPRVQEVDKIAKEAMSTWQGVTAETPREEFSPEIVAAKFPGFSVEQVIASDENRDEWFGPVTGVDAAKHATPDIERDWTRLTSDGLGNLRYKKMDDKTIDYALFKDDQGVLHLRWRVLGRYRKPGEDKLPSVLWLFYLSDGGRPVA